MRPDATTAAAITYRHHRAAEFSMGTRGGACRLPRFTPREVSVCRVAAFILVFFSRRWPHPLTPPACVVRALVFVAAVCCHTLRAARGVHIYGRIFVALETAFPPIGLMAYAPYIIDAPRRPFNLPYFGVASGLRVPRRPGTSWTFHQTPASRHSFPSFLCLLFDLVAMMVMLCNGRHLISFKIL